MVNGKKNVDWRDLPCQVTTYHDYRPEDSSVLPIESAEETVLQKAVPPKYLNKIRQVLKDKGAKPAKFFVHKSSVYRPYGNWDGSGSYKQNIRIHCQDKKGNYHLLIEEVKHIKGATWKEAFF